MASLTETPTEGLVRRAQEADREAFDEVARRHRERLRAFAGSRLGPEVQGRIEPDDVVQETFAWALRSLGRLRWRGEEAFAGWLFTIAKRVILKEVARGACRPVLSLDRDPAGRDPSPSKALRRGERFERLEGALRGLSPEHRRVIELARLEGVPVREIARRLGRSPDAVSQLLRRALAKLREAFGDTESLSLPDRALDPRGEGDGDHGE
ncbi:MAG: sigma-70 family RNA polymerase sigma factor [Planctomycetes bacterium]|nr:sigma-70 family RNA polymerase sigma factor [Planctomycetota bacterium]